MRNGIPDGLRLVHTLITRTVLSSRPAIPQAERFTCRETESNLLAGMTVLCCVFFRSFSLLLCPGRYLRMIADDFTRRSCETRIMTSNVEEREWPALNNSLIIVLGNPRAHRRAVQLLYVTPAPSFLRSGRGNWFNCVSQTRKKGNRRRLDGAGGATRMAGEAFYREASLDTLLFYESGSKFPPMRLYYISPCTGARFLWPIKRKTSAE